LHLSWKSAVWIRRFNAKEIAVCADVSYSPARGWIHLHGFPAFHGVIFWKDFIQWRTGKNGFKNCTRSKRNGKAADSSNFDVDPSC
jgi:hypothetical protein